MNIVFFKTKTFLAQEIANALKKRTDINLLIAAVPEEIPPHAAHLIFDRIRRYLPAIVISINNTGYDGEGALGGLLAENGSFQCNWFLDDPFYETIFRNRRLPPIKSRLEFVSEESFVLPLRDKGHNAYFLPLATDLSYFNIDGPKNHERDCAFAGNSSMDLLDSIITKEAEIEIEKHATLLNDCKNYYFRNPCEADVKKRLLRNSAQWEKAISMPPEQFLFRMEWIVGYFYRRDFIAFIAKKLKKRFMCFGDIYWSKFIDPSQVSTDACYYTNLRDYYRSTKVNLNVNRIQIKTSFTQRIFDCKASGAFVLTEKRKLNNKFFVTEGKDKELAEFTSWQDCADLIDYYCKHDEERERIAMAGREKVLAEHTYDRRIEQVFEICKKEWGI